MAMARGTGEQDDSARLLAFALIIMASGPSVNESCRAIMPSTVSEALGPDMPICKDVLRCDLVYALKDRPGSDNLRDLSVVTSGGGA